MTRTRIALTTFVAFFVSQVMAVLIHGFVLAADYEPFDGTLLRSGADAWQFIFLPVAHLAFICGLVWVYTHAQLTGSRARQGLTLGSLGGSWDRFRYGCCGTRNSHGQDRSS